MDASPTAYYEAVEIIGGRARQVQVDVVRDSAVELYVNGALSASLTATPECLEPLAYGYSIGEGIARDAGDVLSVDVDGGKIYVAVRPAAAGRTAGERQKGALDIRSLFYDILRSQELAPAIRSAHFSIIFSPYGGMVSYAVGADRHCALWKAVGKGVLSGQRLNDAVAICSGPVDSAMVRAATRAGMSAMLSPMSPTDKAVESARRGNIVLMRFDSPARACIYCGEEALSGIEFYRDRLIGPVSW
jgi:formate dehydrogenase assembly factor FdhD